VGTPIDSLNIEQAERKINDASNNFFIVLPLYPTVYDTCTQDTMTPRWAISRRSVARPPVPASTRSHREEHSISATLEDCEFGYKSPLGKVSITNCMIICQMACSSPLLKMYIANLLNAGETFIDRTEDFADSGA
jgi:hypothetical protein